MGRTARSFAGLALVAGLGTLTPAAPAPASPDAAFLGTARLRLADGRKVGDVTFVGRGRTTLVTVDVRLPEGHAALDAFHGLHVHANDDPTNGEGCVADPERAPSTWFTSVDGHLVTEPRGHGAHAGDLPPLLVDADGDAYTSFVTDRFVLDELRSAAVIVHAQSDNLGHIPLGPAADQYTANSPAAIDKTARTGNGGDRIACGVVHVFP